uniref:AP complex subunit sigma n=1 Tax=Saccoglossus kowalevskii TaxID=10224 RepID=A0ABM0H0Y8_SACKO|nr:PREDICTED: AP-4 complex subunit sigma-like [Saccoglossus kowalevskii]
MLKFLLLANKQGHVRLTKYYEYSEISERTTLEADLIRKVLARSENQCSFLDYRDYKVVYRRYASLYFMIGIDHEENEMAILEFIHLLVEVMDMYFNKVCELDIMCNLEKAHMILDEMISNGYIVETNKSRIVPVVVALLKTV